MSAVDRYWVRMLGGGLELDFPGRTIEAPRARGLLGPLILLALNPRQELAVETFKTQLFDVDPGLITTPQIQTPISRLRHAGLPIPRGVYMLDVAPCDVDIVDFDARAKEFIDRAVNLDRLHAGDLVELLEEGLELHHLWRRDPAAAVGNHPRLSLLFDSHRRRNRRFGWVFVRLLIRSGERDRADDVLDQYIERYGEGEVPRDLELHRLLPQRPMVIPSTPGPVGTGAALAEVRDRIAASARMTFDQFALGAHNLDRVVMVDRLILENEALIGAPVEAPGGAAPNTAFALARLGQRATVAGIVADDRFGDLVKQSLEQEGADLSPLLTVPAGPGATTGNTWIFVDAGGGRLTFIQAGVNEQLARALNDDKAAYERLSEAAQNARIVNLSSFSSDSERRLQEEMLVGLVDEVLVGFDPGALYAPLGLDRLAAFILRCDVLYVYEDRLRQLIDNSSSEAAMQRSLPFRAVLEALFRWRAVRVDRPLVAVVKRPRHVGERIEPSTEGYEMITLAVGRASVEELVSDRAPAALEPPAVDTVGQGDAIAAAVHLGLLRGAPLDECADLVTVFANETACEVGSRAGLPNRASVADAWAKYFPRTPLPAWVPRD